MNNKAISIDRIPYAMTVISILTVFLPPIFIPISSSTLILYYGEITFYGLFLVAITLIFKFNKIIINKLFFILISLLFVGFISILNADDYGRYFIGLSTYIEITLIILVFSNIFYSDESIKKLKKYYLISSIFLCVQILYKALIVNDGDFLIGNKIVLELGGSNYLATILMIPFFIALTFVFNKENSFLNVAFLCIIGTSIILTGSRTALILLIILSIVILMKETLFNFKIKFRNKFKYLSLSLLAIFIIYLFTGKFIKQMIEVGRFDNLSNQSNALSRFQIFEDYYNAFLNHPIIGNGLMNVNGLNQNYLAHNFILQAFGDAGFLFGVLFITLIIYMYIYLNKVIKETNENINFVIGFRRGYTAVLLHGLFEPNFGTKLFMLYLFLGFGLIVSENYNLKRKENVK
ncbi:O-antigen ligase family protein [Exiguobacterium sp. s191]|uniref:O-antigen ligase family protein n=1 Tax=Exiguobacterium sp. s191 TaxID=2751196 RepID=UPI001BEC437C|nr:O-antigen ligase family protein [Exiguobacterium sp. s191]